MIDPNNSESKEDDNPAMEGGADKTSSSTSSSAAATPAPSSGGGGRRRRKPKQETPPTKDMIPLHPHFQPGKLDVICSRGKFAYNSPGNCWFRTMVEEQMDNYANARSKTDKSLVVSILVNRVRAANPQGGFVKNFGGRWYRVSDRYSREKVGQQFRDLLHTKYRSSTKAKAEKRKRSQNGETPDLSSCDEASSRSTRARLHDMGVMGSPGAMSSSKVAPSLSSAGAPGMPGINAKMPPPPVIFDTKKLGLEQPVVPKPPSPVPTLQPRLAMRAPDEGELQPSRRASLPNALDQGTMDLGYLDDFEPLPMGNGTARNSRANSLNLIEGLQDSLSNIFDPNNSNNNLINDSSSNTNSDSRRGSLKPDGESDPFNHTWAI